VELEYLAVEMDQSVALVNAVTGTKVRVYTNLTKFISCLPDSSVLKRDRVVTLSVMLHASEPIETLALVRVKS